MFKILSIDGGGIRGIIPAQVLANLENRLRQEHDGDSICEYFDMICGTSTGGILAIALALGIPTSTILSLYLQKAKTIFPKRKLCHYVRSAFCNKPLYNNEALHTALKEAYTDSNRRELKIKECKTRICIPAYDANNGIVKVFKTPHHQDMTTHYEILASDVAMMTSAAPVYFSPYCSNGKEQNYYYNNIVDGGLVANNPALIGLIETVYGLGHDINDVRILSIGTGNVKFGEKENANKMGMRYFLNPLNRQKKLRIYEMMSSAQSEYISNTIKIMADGLGHDNLNRFVYRRIQHEFAADSAISMDASDEESLNSLVAIGYSQFQDYVEDIFPIFFKSKGSYTL